MWVVNAAGSILADVISPNANNFQIARATVSYKTLLELWLETLRDEYERDLARSPLERGVLVGENRLLDTCFTFGPNGVIAMLNNSSAVSPLVPLPIGPRDLDIGGLQTTAISARSATKTRALETVTRWNALEQRLATLLSNRRAFPGKPGKLNDPRVVGVLVDRWAKMRQDDPDNLDFAAAMKAIKLSEAQRRILKAVGVTDLKSTARALKAAPVIERYNGDIDRRQKAPKAERSVASAAASINFPLSQKMAEEIRRAIGDALLLASPKT